MGSRLGDKRVYWPPAYESRKEEYLWTVGFAPGKVARIGFFLSKYLASIGPLLPARPESYGYGPWMTQGEVDGYIQNMRIAIYEWAYANNEGNPESLPFWTLYPPGSVASMFRLVQQPPLNPPWIVFTMELDTDRGDGAVGSWAHVVYWQQAVAWACGKTLSGITWKYYATLMMRDAFQAETGGKGGRLRV